jgi:hypothetical protein
MDFPLVHAGRHGGGGAGTDEWRATRGFAIALGQVRSGCGGRWLLAEARRIARVLKLIALPNQPQQPLHFAVTYAILQQSLDLLVLVHPSIETIVDRVEVIKA